MRNWIIQLQRKRDIVPLGHRGDWAPRGNVWGLIVTEVL